MYCILMDSRFQGFSLGYSADTTNPVGAEYLLLEKLEGEPLSGQWFSMDNKTRVKIMRQIIDLERRFMTILFPASGSLYYRRDLEASQTNYRSTLWSVWSIARSGCSWSDGAVLNGGIMSEAC